jgi:hypothetical protein
MEDSLVVLLVGFVLWTLLLLVGWLANLSRSSPWWLVLTFVFGTAAAWLYTRTEKILFLVSLRHFKSSPLASPGHLFSLKSKRPHVVSRANLMGMPIKMAYRICCAPAGRIFRRQANSLDLALLLSSWFFASWTALRLVSAGPFPAIPLPDKLKYRTTH